MSFLSKFKWDDDGVGTKEPDQSIHDGDGSNKSEHLISDEIYVENDRVPSPTPYLFNRTNGRNDINMKRVDTHPSSAGPRQTRHSSSSSNGSGEGTVST